jgi:hypothetical protein
LSVFSCLPAFLRGLSGLAFICVHARLFVFPDFLGSLEALSLRLCAFAPLRLCFFFSYFP